MITLTAMISSHALASDFEFSLSEGDEQTAPQKNDEQNDQASAPKPISDNPVLNKLDLLSEMNDTMFTMSELLENEAFHLHTYTVPAMLSQSRTLSYPYATQYGISGTVWMHIVITQTGHVQRPKIFQTRFWDREGHEIAHFAEIEANALSVAQQTRFTPATKDGIPVAAYADLIVPYHFPR